MASSHIDGEEPDDSERKGFGIFLIKFIGNQDWFRRIFDWHNVSSIRVRLLISFVLMALLPAIGISLGSILAGYFNVRSQALDRLGSVANLKEYEIESWAVSLQDQLASALNEEYSSERAHIILKLDSENKYSNLYTLATRNRFQRFLDRSLLFDELFLMTPDGKVVLSTEVSHEGQYVSGDSKLPGGLQRPFVEFLSIAWDSKRPTAVAVLPVADADGAFLGAIAGIARLDHLNEILASKSGLGNTGKSYLVDEDHDLLDVSLNDGQRPTTLAKLYSEGIDYSLSTRTNGAGVYKDYAGVQVVGVYRWLPDIGLVLVNEQNLLETTQGIITTLEINLLIALGAVLLAVIASWVITRSIASPIEDLVGTTAQIASGDLNRTAKVSRKDEIGALAQAFNSMTAQLRDLISGLEQRVEERTRALQRRALQLETSAQVSREATSILNINVLLNRVTELIREVFGYSNVHIYLVDTDEQMLILSAKSGEPSARITRVSIGKGSLNGEVAQTNTAILVNDVEQDPRYLQDEQLQDTRSELVLPLRLGNRLIGTLDVQSTQLNAFNQDDLMVLQSLGDQIAISIENAHLYERAKELATLEERNRLARELHDSVTQSLFSLSLMAGGWKRSADAGKQVPVEEYLAQFGEIIDSSLKEMRLLIYQLRPPTLEKEGLLGAIRQRLDAVEKRAGVEARLVAEELIVLPPPVEEALYWITQEALNNALKHANATQVLVKVSVKDKCLNFEIRDNGRGFDLERHQNSGGMGLTTMRERARQIGADLVIQTEIGCGTVVLVNGIVEEINFVEVPFSLAKRGEVGQ